MSLRRLASAVVLAIFASLGVGGLGGCADPVHDDDVAALGPEPDGAPPGPNHRPGQPCLTCHGGKGPADLELALGGTVFQVRGSAAPLGDATVSVNDGDNQTRTFTTNAAGNFFVARSDWDISFPLDITVQSGTVKKTMTTRVGRDGGCGSCHRGQGDSSHMPGIFVRDQ